MFTFSRICGIIFLKNDERSRKEMTIGERISCLRKKQGLTQVKLAELLGVTDKAVSKWERNISFPDISILPNIAVTLCVTVDELFRENAEDIEKPAGKFISLEKYLMGEFGCVVPDIHPKDEEIVLIIDSPDTDEAEHGYALSGRAGVEVNSYFFGNREPFALEEMKSGKLGITYISNVPLLNITPPINKLVDELEYTRLNKYHINLFLLQSCMKKFCDLILSDTVKIIALTREFNKKYFGAFISYARDDILSVLHNKISSGKLKILFVVPPLFWNKEDCKKSKDLAELKACLVQ